MLTRVSVGQVRFNLGGLAADARGVATGKDLLIRFATLDRLVGFLRLASAERLPDEMWSSLAILYARPAGGGREVMVRAAHPGGELADLVVARARLAGGIAYTGTGRMFVPARETRAPLGYDVVTVPQDEGDFCVIGTEGVTSFRQEGTLAFERLVLRLELRRRPGGVRQALADAHSAEGANDGASPVIVSARRGLAPVLLKLLYREGVAARAAIIEPRETGPFSGGFATWLFSIPALPERLGALCARTPGLGLFLPVHDDVLVAAGWQHPIDLAGARAALGGERLLLFSPAPAPPLEIAPRPSFVALSDLVELELGKSLEKAGPVHALPAETGQERDLLVVPLRLEPLGLGPARVRATLVPWAQAGWVRRLLFALPAVVLRSYRVAFVEAGVLLVGEGTEGALDSMPFGQPLEEPQPGLFVPVGHRLSPALSIELLAERLGIADGALCVFPAPGAPAFRVAAAAFEPLERKALARTEIPWAAPPNARAIAPLAGEPSAAPEIENEPLGLLPLWGWRP